MIRAVLGLGGLLGALALFWKVFPPYWPQEVVDLLKSDQIGPAIERALTTCREPGLAIPACMLVLFSVVVLAWPPKRELVFTPLNGQGVAS